MRVHLKGLNHATKRLADGRRVTYLPQVWEAIPDPRDFVAALKRKAGWSEGFWSARVNVFRYGATKWTERESLGAEAQR